jgi:UDP-N-acetylglucosamine 2-epimerase (non-hydrolysing)
VQKSVYNVLMVLGTRPEAIKMAPVYKALAAAEGLRVQLCITAQHRQMLDQSLAFFEIEPDYDLNLMQPGQTLHGLSAAILQAMPAVLETAEPDLVLVHGDTSTSTFAALSAFYKQIPVGHVEAGLRTYDLTAPFPEEANRQLTARLTTLHFAPTVASQENLLQESILPTHIYVTGNTVIDALFWSIDKVRGSLPTQAQEAVALLDPSKPLVLVTGHRRENFGEGFLNICQALKRIALEGNAQVIYPVHLNPNVRKPVFDLLAGVEGIHLIEPLPYEAFVWLMDKAKLVITDSGGIQEEAPSLGKPVLVMRNTTERPEAVEAGTVILVGTDPEKIASEALDLLRNTQRYDGMSHAHNPYGDGKAAGRIVAAIQGYFGVS